MAVWYPIPTIFFFLLYLLLIPPNGSSSSSSSQIHQEGFISGSISEKGLDYAKDLLIQKAISSILQLQLPQIEQSVSVRFIGNCRIVLSNISITDVRIGSSYVKTGEKGVILVASGATANMSMKWGYSCSTWLLPIAVSDSGDASVKVEGMQMGLTVDLKNQEGTLQLVLLDYGCYVGELSIKLDGGASWLYQRIVDIFGGEIASAVENSISEEIREGISNLNNSLQSLPKQIPLDKTSVLNISFVENPVFTNSSIEFEINGLFTRRNEVLVSQGYHRGSDISFSCGGSSEMIKISLHENVLKSASLVYFNAGYMQWVVDELPDQALLNTAGWRFIVPQLYKRYPNDDMKLNISVSSPPIVEVTNQDISATIFVDIIIDVLDAGDVIPVACISMEISASCSAKISRNNIAGSLILNDFSTYLKWSKIGRLHVHLIQLVMSTLLRIFIPFVNLLLSRGIALPDLHGFTFQNAHIFYNDPWVTVCSNISYLGKYNPIQYPAHVL